MPVGPARTAGIVFVAGLSSARRLGHRALPECQKPLPFKTLTLSFSEPRSVAVIVTSNEGEGNSNEASFNNAAWRGDLNSWMHREVGG